MLNAVLFVGGSYLWGAIPTAYLVTRYLKGVDIRDYGSGNVGAANVFSLVGKRVGWLLGTFDSMGKGALPVFLADVFDQSLSVQVAIGLAAIAGHNWSPYIRFTGGRGVATAVGVVFGLQMWWEFLVLTVVMGGIGRLLLRESGLWTLISMMLLPLLAFLFGREPEILYMTAGIGTLLIAKRLTANWQLPSGEYSLPQVMAYRFLWDRDVPKKLHWTSRQSTSQGGISSADVED